MDSSIQPGSKSVAIVPRLRAGDGVTIIATSSSCSLVSVEVRAVAKATLERLGLQVQVDPRALLDDGRGFAPLDERVAAFHDSVTDPNVHLILACLGGLDSNLLLDRIDYEAVAKHPKFYCGMSDNACVLNAIHAKTGLVAHYGPNWSHFGMLIEGEYTIEAFRRCFFEGGTWEARPSTYYRDDPWYKDQETATIRKNTGPVAVRKGHGRGRLLGGCAQSFLKVAGTPYCADFEGRLLFLEMAPGSGEDEKQELASILTALSHRARLDRIAGLVLGRSAAAARWTHCGYEELAMLVPALKGVPIAAGFDFGHTTPLGVMPIGAFAELHVEETVEFRVEW